MSTERKDDRNEGVCAYPLEVSEIERFRMAMGKGGIVRFNCHSPFVFLIYGGHAGHAALLKIWIGMPRRTPDLGKGQKPKRGLEVRPEAIRGHRRRSGLKFYVLHAAICWLFMRKGQSPLDFCGKLTGTRVSSPIPP